MRNQWFKTLVVASILVLLGVMSGVAQVILISPGAVWKYLDDGSDQGTSWTGTAFSDGGWASGPAPLGYGDTPGVTLATTNNFGPDAQNKFATTYYRHGFTVPDASSVTNLRARVRRDDGVIVYLNGTEVFRDNMPTGAVSFSTYVTNAAADDGATFIPFNVSAGLLFTGNNVVAAEIHQNNATSTDTVYDLELLGNPLPTIAITSPTNGQVIANANLQVAGTATPGGPSINLIEVFAGATKVGESTSANFSVVWQGVTPGAYTLTARITDGFGLRATSAPVAITVQAPPSGTLVSTGDPWRYFIGTQEASTPSTLWRQAGFSDGAWSIGATPIGYGDAGLGTAIRSSSSAPTYLSVYMRKTFQVVNPSAYAQLDLQVVVDDGAVVWINGVEMGRINVPAGELLYNDAAIEAQEQRTLSVTVNDPASVLVAGQNVLAVHGFNANLTSSDLFINAELRGTVDTQVPFVTRQIPPATATVRELIAVEIIFSEPVAGVDASDLLVAGRQATNVVVVGPDQYVFEYAPAPTGTVVVAWSSDNGIRDLAATPNPFAGGSWTYTVNPNAEPATVIISEFMAANSKTLNDEDGNSSDWIELYNAGTVSASLGGWFLTDEPANLTKWRIPGVTLLPGQFLIIFASAEDPNVRTNVTGQLHANFSLRANGEYLALVDNKTNVVSAFSPTFPEQFTDVSYGRDIISPDLVGYFETPTPGQPNSTRGRNFAPDVVFSQPSRTFINSFALTLSTPADPTAQIRYVLVNNGASAAATNVPTQGSTLYTGPIQVTATVQVRARAFSLAADVFPGTPRSESYVQLNSNLAGFTSDVPLVLIHNFGTGQFPEGAGTSLDRSSVVMIFDTKFGRSSLTNIPDVATRSGINLRGSSTQGYPKRSYAVEFWDELNNDTDFAVLDMPPESDWVLYAPNQFDIPLIHNPIAFELSNDVGQYAARTRMVEVFVDTDGGEVAGPAPGGTYNGVYVLMEKLKRNPERVDIDRLEVEQRAAPEITGGYFMKIDRVDQNERTFSAGGATIVYVEPDGLEMVTPQRTLQANYIRDYINAMNTALAGSTYTNYIDEIAWIDHSLLNTLPINVDALRLSGFFYKPRDQVDRHGVVIKPGKFVMGPVWDYDRSQGSTRGDIANGRPWSPIAWMGQDPGGGDPGTCFFAANVVFANPWYRQLFTKVDFWQKFVDRYQDLSDGPFSTNHIFAIIDRLADELRESQARDVVRWGGNGGSDTRPRTGSINQFGYQHTFDGTFQGEIDFQKKWYADRIHFIDTNFLDRPILSSGGGEVESGFQLTIAGPPGSTLYYTLNGTDPRAPGGTVAAGALSAPGVATITVNNNVQVFARAFDANHKNLTGTSPNTVINPPVSTPWSGWRKATFVVNMPSLRITEVMYHPLPAPPNSPYLDEDFEYIEVKNIGASVLNLNGFKLGGGVQFKFPNLNLNPGQNAVIPSYVAGFSSRYATNGMVILGQYTGLLANEGDHVVLEGPLGEIIHDFNYDDDWYPATDGFGFSLEIRNATGSVTNWNGPAGWQASALRGGSPAQDNGPGVTVPVVLINEALTHTDLPLVDAIELYNPNPTSVNIGGWFLSDDFRTPKYRIPNGTTIAGNGYFVFDQNQFDSVSLPATNRFNLRSSGDDVYLFSADLAGNLTGYIQGYAFGAALNGVSFGRYLISTGEEDFVAQKQNTLNSANAGPRVGPIVISEIMYHPPDLLQGNRPVGNSRDEYIELYNITGAPVPLYDLTATTNTYRLRDAVDYTFPMGQTLPVDGRILVVPFDPNLQQDVAAAFRSQYGLPQNVVLYGPYEGQLSNGGESVELIQPDLVVFYQTNQVITGVLIDKVNYKDSAPWPGAADGYGPSLQRLVPASYGNDPANWVAALPTPSAGFTPGQQAPLITGQPLSQTALAFTEVTLSVTATGPSLRYQWLLNGEVVPDETNAVLRLTRAQPNQAGTYQAVVFNAGGSALSDLATLTLLIPANITQQPRPVSVREGQPASFSVFATSSSPISYQWRFNGVPIPGATLPSYSVASAQRGNDGIYDVVLTDAVGPVTSDPARLTVLINPVVVNLNTNYIVVQGANLTMGIEVDGTLPMGYRWRRGSSSVKLEVINSFQSFFTLTNVQPVENPTASTNRYSVVLTNAAFSTPGVLSPSIFITVLADSDGDGLPDVWETQYTGAGDPNADTDGDGLTNGEEYTSGTNPLDSNSYLRVERFSIDGDVSLEFNAAANVSYSVQYKNALEAPAWTKLADVVSASTNRTVVIRDREVVPERFYRLVAPRQE